jgi:carbonic anhydrase
MQTQSYSPACFFRPVVVVGHTECGGADASLSAAQNPSFAPDGSITTIPSLSSDHCLNRWLRPLTAHVNSLKLSGVPRHEALPIVVAENVKLQVENLCITQTIMDAWSNVDPEKRKVWVHGWVYDLASGRLKDLEISRGPTEST